MPDATAKIWSQMGLGDIKKLALSELAWGQLPLGTKLGEVQPVFPRADKSAIERMQKMEEEHEEPGSNGTGGCRNEPAATPRLAVPAITPPAPAKRKDFH
jgi:methionyl-tRNA synthetase